MVAMNGVNKVGVSFQGDQDQRKSGGILFPAVLGTAAGVGVAGLTTGFTKPNLEGVTKDTFSKAMAEVKDLTEEQQKAVKTIEEHLATNPTEEPKTDGATDAKPSEAPKPNAEQKVDVKPADGTPPKSLVASKSLEEVFGQEAEISPDKYLKKYGYGATTATIETKKAGVQADIKRTQSEMAEATKQSELASRYVENRQNAETLQNEIAEIEKEVQRAKDAANAEAAAKKTGITDAAKIAEIDTELQGKINDINQQAVKDLKSKTRQLSELDRVAGRLESKIRIQDEKGALYAAQFGQDNGKIAQAIKDQGYEKGGAQEAKILEEETDRVLNKHLDSLKKAGDATPPYHTAAEYTQAANTYLSKPEVQKEINDAAEVRRSEQATKISNEVIRRQKEEHFARLRELAQKKVDAKVELLANHQAKIEEMGADLELIKGAQEGKTNISRAQADGVLSKTKGKLTEALSNVKNKAENVVNKVADEAKKLPEAVENALKEIKGKLPKEFKATNWKGLGWGAGIGLVGAVVLKLIFGGKSEE